MFIFKPTHFWPPYEDFNNRYGRRKFVHKTGGSKRRYAKKQRSVQTRPYVSQEVIVGDRRRRRKAKQEYKVVL